MNETDLDLIQRELDDENEPEERARLHELLERSEEARKTYDELRMVASELDALPLADPPQHLWANVMDALPDARPAKTSRLAAFVDDLRAALSARPALAFTYAFTIGLLVGIGLFTLLGDGRPDADDAFAILASDTAAGEAYESTVAASGFAADLRVYATNGLLVVDLDATAEGLADVRIVLEDGLAFKGLTHQAGAPARSVQTSEGAVDLRLGGTARYVVLFSRPAGPAPPLRFELWRDGERIHVETARLRN